MGHLTWLGTAQVDSKDAFLMVTAQLHYSLLWGLESMPSLQHEGRLPTNMSEKDKPLNTATTGGWRQSNSQCHPKILGVCSTWH